LSFEDENLDSVYDLLWGQFKEDREEIKDLYDDLKTYVKEKPERYAIAGDTLAKYAELMTKQTNQVLELAKLIQKSQSSDNDAINDADIAAINKALSQDFPYEEKEKTKTIEEVEPKETSASSEESGTESVCNNEP